MRFERRIYLAILIVVAGFLPLVGGAFLSIREIVEEQSLVGTRYTQALLLSQRLRYLDSTESSLIPVYVLTGEKNLVDIYEKQGVEFESLLNQLLAVETDPKLQILIGEISDCSKLLKAGTPAGLAMKRSGASMSKVNDYFTSVSGPISERRKSLLNDLIVAESKSREAARAHVGKVIHWVTLMLVFLSLLALGLVALTGRLLGKTMRQRRANDEAQAHLMEQERRLSHARKETLEVVSHDLKNPLGIIKMSVELMLEEMSESQPASELRENLQMTHRSAESMERLIKDLLDHAKIESGHLALEQKLCDLGPLVKDLVQRFDPLARNKQIFLSSKIETHAFADCDCGRIEQVISNLLGNAIKFTPPGGTIRVETVIDMKNLVISIADSGKGISEEQVPHIFERFWQVRETSKQGTGLGLAIAKSIVDAHKGRIWVESTMGQGSRFFVSLPLATLPENYVVKDWSQSLNL